MAPVLLTAASHCKHSFGIAYISQTVFLFLHIFHVLPLSTAFRCEDCSSGPPGTLKKQHATSSYLPVHAQQALAQGGTDTVLFLRAVKSVLSTKCLWHFLKL